MSRCFGSASRRIEAGRGDCAILPGVNQLTPGNRVTEVCAKCGQQNREGVQFCLRCHTPLRYTCPSCRHVQRQSGACLRCGVDFGKYGMARLAALQVDLERQREHTRKRTALLRSVLLAPVTGGYSLISYMRKRGQGG